MASSRDMLSLPSDANFDIIFDNAAGIPPRLSRSATSLNNICGDKKRIGSRRSLTSTQLAVERRYNSSKSTSIHALEQDERYRKVSDMGNARWLSGSRTSKDEASNRRAPNPFLSLLSSLPRLQTSAQIQGTVHGTSLAAAGKYTGITSRSPKESLTSKLSPSMASNSIMTKTLHAESLPTLSRQFLSEKSLSNMPPRLPMRRASLPPRNVPATAA